MRKRPLFNGGPEVGVVGLSLSAPPTGSLPLNQLAALAPASEDPAESGEERIIETIRRALELGVNLIDTDWITANGHAQEVAGRALEIIPRESFILTGKSGPRLTFHGELTIDNSRANLINQCHDSLFRLKTDHVDLYQVHWPDGTAPEQTAKGLMDAQHAGQAKWAGVCNYSLSQIKQLADHVPLQTAQAPLSILNRVALDDLLPWCNGNGVGYLASNPLQSGLLAGKFSGDEEFTDADRDAIFTQPTFGRAVEFARELNDLSDYSASQLAVGWCLAQEHVACVLCPGASADEVAAFAQVAENPLESALVTGIDELAKRHGFIG